MESGTALVPWAYQRNQTEISFKTAAIIDEQFTSSRDSELLLQVLQSVDAKSLDNAALAFTNQDSGVPESAQRSQLQQGFYYTPVIDSFSHNPVVPGYQYELFSQGEFNQVPILIGTCSEEGLINLDREWLSYFLVRDILQLYC